MTGGDNGDESGDAHGAISGSNSSPGSDGNQPSCVICIPKYQWERIKRILELRSAALLPTSEHIRTYQNYPELWKLRRSKCSNQRWNRLTSWTTGSSRLQAPKCLGAVLTEIHADPCGSMGHAMGHVGSVGSTLFWSPRGRLWRHRLPRLARLGRQGQSLTKWRCQVALPSGAAKSLSKVFSLSHLSHLSHLSPQMDNFHHFLHLSSFVISRHLSSSEFSSILRRCRRARRSGAPWSMVSMSAMDGAGGAGRAAMWWCCDALSWSDVGNCWKLLEIVGMIDVKWSRSAQEVLKKVKSQRVNFSKLFKSQYWRCLKSKFDLEESAWR